MAQDGMAVAKNLFVGGGEMGALMRSYDWSKTPLGSVDQWPQSLRSALSICLNSRFPIAIYWGADCVLLYNDAWRPIVGDKHPWSLGRPAREVWPEIWNDIGPEFERVFATGEGIFHSDELLAMQRFGYTEECFFDYTFNPIQGEGGGIDGVLNIVSETTYRVLNDRRARLLREVASKTGAAKTVEDACTLMEAVFKSAPADMPFWLLYLVNPDGKQARFCAGTEFTLGNPHLDNHVAPAVIDLDAINLEVVNLDAINPEAVKLNAKNSSDAWSIARVVQAARPEELHDVPTRFGTLPGSPWSEPPQEAMVLPIATSGHSKVLGVLVAVANPRRRLDDNYRDFFTQIAGQIATAIANARSYEEERQRAEQLAELDRAKTVFFSNISHEFRTPLTLMLGPIEDALQQTPDAEQRDRLELVHRNALRLQKLVNTLLDFSRIEAGRIEAIYEPTDLALLTRDLAGIFRSAIERAGVRFCVDCPPLPEPIYVDREMWEKIVLNLLSNAFKFTFEGEIRISLRLGERMRGQADETASVHHPIPPSPHHSTTSDLPVPLVILEVQDTGIGIPAEELPHIFERFHRVQGARGRTYEGSGIGLSLVQELVRLHGGSIGVSSMVNQGTRFTISIPTGYAHLPSDRLQQDNAQRMNITRTLTSTATGATPYIEEALRWIPERAEVKDQPDQPLGNTRQGTEAEPDRLPFPSCRLAFGARILLADDNADMRDYLNRLLSQHYEVQVVGDGVAALAAIRQQMPDLLLTDVMMPEMDGFELLRSLRSNSKTQDLPIILLSARAGEEARIEGLEAGADDYLTKPFSARELLARVEASLKLSQLRQESAQKEQALRVEVQTAKNSLEKLLSRIADQFLALDCQWRYTYVNDRVMDVTGMAREDLLGKCIWDLFPDLVNSNFYASVHRAVATQTSVQFEYFYPLWNRWFENHVYPSGDGVSIIVTDITDRKQAEENLRESEERYRAIVNQALTGVAYSSIGGKLTLVNQKYCDITGYSAEELSQLRMHDITHPEDLPRNIELYNRMMVDGTPFEIEKRYIRKDGSIVWVNNSVSAICDRNGNPQSVVAIVLDVTERKQAEAERDDLLARERAAREDAEMANRVKDEFLAVLSHELRSPLNPILGWSTLLLGNKLDAAKTTQALVAIQRNAKLQSELIEDLLDVSRILRGKLSLNVAPVNLVAIIQEAMETVRLAAQTKGIDLRFATNDFATSDFATSDDVDAGKRERGTKPGNQAVSISPSPIQVLGDSTRLQQVVWNLLSNAVKFTPEGGRVDVRLERYECAGMNSPPNEPAQPLDLNPQISTQPLQTYAQITVSDTGQGIAPHFLPYVFDYFRQADAATTRKFGGLGLGLAIARHLVELHGGTIQVESCGEGQGATFTVKLPLMQLDEPVNSDSQLSEETLDLSGIQVLVVDDDDDTREFVSFLINQCGANVISVASAEEALVMLTRFQPNVLLSDIGMPEVDGYTLMQQVRALPAEQGGQIPAIALTAYAGEIDYQRAMAAGFQRHIPKPVEPAKLVEAIASLLEQEE